RNRWIWRANPMRLWHVTLRKAAPKRGITCDQAVSGIIDAWGLPELSDALNALIVVLKSRIGRFAEAIDVLR
ncbi:MAG: hypothetical protein AB7E72_14280, partial [Lysobacterales bacterium]